MVFCQHLSLCRAYYHHVVHIQYVAHIIILSFIFSVSCILSSCRSYLVCCTSYEISAVKISLSNNYTIIIIGVYRQPDKLKIPELTIKLNEFLPSTSQSDDAFIVGDLNINLLDSIAIKNDFINNCHSNSVIPLIRKPNRNANNNPSNPHHTVYGQISCTIHSMVYFY